MGDGVGVDVGEGMWVAVAVGVTVGVGVGGRGRVAGLAVIKAAARTRAPMKARSPRFTRKN